MSFFTTNEFWAACIGAMATILAAWFAVFFGLRTLRDTEIKRLRIKCVIELMAYRFILVPGVTTSIEGKMSFFAALNSIPGLFGHDPKVMLCLRDFREVSSAEKNSSIMKLIRIVADVAGVPLSAVSNIDLERPFSDKRH
ncbi:hypothetical protein NKW43_05765 [Gluconobacter albidus]|uniref:hypothetical protein n=1 Tax=Gluconobacter albidus TaxID=318683 RepID=UPI0020A1C141|nr:hypothetical protein [Gluconobacter albidus]MCP1273191.1 hypothetical protein [Gluconobacter albidus]